MLKSKSNETRQLPYYCGKLGIDSWLERWEGKSTTERGTRLPRVANINNEHWWLWTTRQQCAPTENGPLSTIMSTGPSMHINF